MAGAPSRSSSCGTLWGSHDDHRARPGSPGPADSQAKPKIKPKFKSKAPGEPRLSRQRRPEKMAADDWPRVLRRQFGSEQAFDLQRLDGLDLKAARRLPVFADFWVGNAATGGRYQVAIRGALPGDSLCSCLDFATNDLGTCKHIEFTLARLRARRGGKAALKQGFAPPYSEVHLHQAGLRTVRFRLGADCPPGLLDRARQLFDEAAGWVLPPARLAELDRFIQTHEHETNPDAHALRVDDCALAYVAQLRDAQHRQQVLQGLRPARQQQYREEAFCRITSYDKLLRDVDLIGAWAPELLIIDEAQRVKYWNTVAAPALKRIDSPYAFVLTGTPLENRLEDLIAIVQLVDQHRLGPTWRLLHDHQQVDEAGPVVGYRDLGRIGATLAPILLRRRKAEVLPQLPERVGKTLFVPMTAEQGGHHDENGLIVTRIGSRWRKTGYLSDVDQRRLQCALQNMRMSCNSTWLLDHETDFGHKADELMTLLEELFEQPDANAVVYSQWLGTHEVLMRRLRQRGWGHVLFHGGAPADQRGALVDRFTQDADCRLFLSTDAGGVGLNLQHAAATTVVNMNLPWNPAKLDQRAGRVHRMGRRRGVQVIKLVAQGSIEQGMLGVLAFKQSLFARVLDGGDSAVFMNGTRLSKFMASVDEVTGAIGVAEEAVGDAGGATFGHTRQPRRATTPRQRRASSPTPQRASAA